MLFRFNNQYIHQSPINKGPFAWRRDALSMCHKEA